MPHFLFATLLFAATDQVLLYDMSPGARPSAAGNAQVEPLPEGGVRVRFGDDPAGGFQLVQFPNAPDLHQVVSQHPDLNGFRIRLRGNGTISGVRFQVQIRNPENLKDIRGRYAYGPIPLDDAEWHDVDLPFAALQGSGGQRGMPREAFAEFVPQLQFTANAGERMQFDLLSIELAAVPETIALPKPKLDGRGLLPTILEEAQAQDLEAVGAIDEPFRQGLRLNGLWQRRPCPIGQVEAGQWERLRVPSMLGRNRPDRAMWYARRFVWPYEYRDRRSLLTFDAVMGFAEVWLNGQRLGQHAGAWTPFTLDATDAVAAGENTLVVYVVDLSYGIVGDAAIIPMSSNPLFKPGPPPNDRGGIWQDVTLLAEPDVRIDDVFVKTSHRRNRLTAEVTIANHTAQPVTVTPTCHARLVDEPGTTAKQFVGLPVTIPANQTAVATVSDNWPEAKRWSPESPTLYFLDTTLRDGRQTLDNDRVRFGFREFRIDGGGFLLNEVPVRLRGESHARGHGFMPAMWRDDFMREYWRTMKSELGFNADRIHASIGAPALFNAADEIGILLIDQSSIWSAGASRYARGGDQFLANTEQEFGEWVRRDRNHPSVVIWDVENEMVRGNPDHWSWVQKLDSFALAHDDTRPLVHSGAGWCLGHADIYHQHHEEHYTALWEAWQKNPDKPMIAGEWWVGGRSGEWRLIDGAEFETADEWFDLSLEHWRERMEEQRQAGISGIMPFAFSPKLFRPLVEGRPPELDWRDPTDAQAQPDRADNLINPGWIPGAPPFSPISRRTAVFRHGLGALHVSVRQRYRTLDQDGRLRRTIFAVNDSESMRSLTVRWSLPGGDGGRRALQLAPGESADTPIDLAVPDGDGELSLHVELTERDQVVDQVDVPLLRVTLPEVKRPMRLGLYDPAGRTATAKALVAAGILTQPVEWPPPIEQFDALVIGADAFNTVPAGAAGLLYDFVQRGGRVLCLRQTTPIDWSPYPFGWYSSVTALQPAWQGFGLPESWRGLNYTRHTRFTNGFIWAWLRDGDGRLADDVLTKPNLDNRRVKGNLRPIAFGTRREHLTIADVPCGRGAYTFCQLHLVENVPVDPLATAELRRLVAGLTAPNGLGGQPVVVVGRELGDRLRQTLGAELTVVEPNAAVPDGADTIIVSSAVTDEQLPKWLAAKRVILMPRKSTPKFAEGRLTIVDEPSEADFASCERLSGPGWLDDTFVGLNCFDFQRWTRPVTIGSMVAGDGAMAIVTAHSLTESFTGGGVGLRTETMKPRGDTVVRLDDRGRTIYLCQLDLEPLDDPRTQYVWSVVLTNLGVPLATERPNPLPRCRILRAEEIKLDGDLNDWTSDIEDRNVTLWKHADPLRLSRERGVVYLMWSPEQLYVAGRLSIPTEGLELTVRLGERTETIGFRDGTLTVADGAKSTARWGAQASATPDVDQLAAGTPVSFEVALPPLSTKPGDEVDLRVEAGGEGWPAGGEAAKARLGL